MTAPKGLCGGCRHARAVRSDRGSTFLLCLRSRSDARYPKYPCLPVRTCPGYRPAKTIGGSARPSGSPPAFGADGDAGEVE